MDRKIRKKTRQYFRRVRIFLPVYGKDEKQFVRNLRNDMEEYIDAHPSCSWKDICDEFETPYEAICPLFLPRIFAEASVAENGYALFLSSFLSCLR